MGLFIFLVVGLPIWFFFIAPQLKHNRLVDKGVRAPGRLLSVEESGTVVNESPELELVVEFTRKDGVLDTSTTDFVPSLRTLHMFQPGVSVTAAYNPEDPDEITVVELGTSPMQVTMPDGTTYSAQSVADSLRRTTDSLRRALEEMNAAIEEAKKKAGR
jgi:hypothetical protein